MPDRSIRGFILRLPQLGAACPCRHGRFLYLPAQSLFHGILPRLFPKGVARVFFRFNFSPVATRRVISFCVEEAPNSCIGGAGAAAPLLSPGELRVSQSGPCALADSLILCSFCVCGLRSHEYLRGVSVVQGLPPWLVHTTSPTVLALLDQLAICAGATSASCAYRCSGCMARSDRCPFCTWS